MHFTHIGEEVEGIKISKEEEIALNKVMSKRMSELYSEIKKPTCICCGKAVSSFCNSHNVPRFCLESIAVNGKVSGLNAILGLPSMGQSIGKPTPGINESGTFRLICRECDSTIFQDYENPDNYLPDMIPSQKMMSEIAMKNYLKFISKKQIELAMNPKTYELCENRGFAGKLIQKRLRASFAVGQMDMKAYTEGFHTAQKISKKKNPSGFYIVYYRLLDYVVPVAAQIPITLAIDIEGEVVNNIYNLDPMYKMTDLHVCIFPMKTQSAILLFINDGDKRYRNFYKQLRKCDDETQLGIINYMVFLYSEDYFLAGDISERLDLSALKETASITQNLVSLKPISNASAISEHYSLANWKSIPNLLSEEFKIR